MEIYDDKTYETLQREYKKAGLDVSNTFNRAMLGVMPFHLEYDKKVEECKVFLGRAYRINGELIKMVSDYEGVTARTVKSILDKNEEELISFGVEECAFCIEDTPTFVELSFTMCKEIENASVTYHNPLINRLLIRSYTLLSLFIGG